MNLFFSIFGFFVDWDLKSLLLFAVVFIITADYVKNRRPLGFPPGPRALPIVGNIFTWDQNRPHEKLTEVWNNLKL